MNLKSHNFQLIPEITHYDNKGNKVKTISYPPKNVFMDKDNNITLTLYDADGTVKDVFMVPFRSFNHNFATVNNIRLTTLTSNVTTKDTGGTNRTLQAYWNKYGYIAPTPANVSTWGIQVGASGSATATQSIDTYKLAAQINHGTGNGQLAHSACVHDTSLTDISGSVKWSIHRTFTNSSAANVNVKEVGWVANVYSAQYKILYARDIKDSNGNDINVTVAPAQVLTIDYNFFLPKEGGMNKTWLGFFASECNDIVAIPSARNDVGKDDYYDTAAANTVQANYHNYYGAGVGVEWNGIMVGTGTATESCHTPGTLANYITHGSGSGQLMFNENVADGEVDTYSTSGSAAEWNLRRVFTNYHSDPITITEAMIIGCLGSQYLDGIKTNNKSIFARKLTGNQTIPSGSSLEINFKFMIEA